MGKEVQLRLSLSKGCGDPPGSSPKAGMTFQSCLKLGVGNHSFIFPTDQSLNSSHSRRRHNSGLSGFFSQGPQLLAEGSSSTPGSQGNKTFISARDPGGIPQHSLQRGLPSSGASLSILFGFHSKLRPLWNFFQQ